MLVGISADVGNYIEYNGIEYYQSNGLCTFVGIGVWWPLEVLMRSMVYGIIELLPLHTDSYN